MTALGPVKGGLQEATTTMDLNAVGEFFNGQNQGEGHPPPGVANLGRGVMALKHYYRHHPQNQKQSFQVNAQEPSDGS